MSSSLISHAKLNKFSLRDFFRKNSELCESFLPDNGSLGGTNFPTLVEAATSTRGDHSFNERKKSHVIFFNSTGLLYRMTKWFKFSLSKF